MLQERVVPVQVDLGILELRLITGEIRLRLLERRLKRPRIELGDEAARVHGLAFHEADSLDGAGDLRMDVDGIVGDDRPDAGHGDRKVGHLDLGRDHGYRQRRWAGLRLRLTGAAPPCPEAHGGDRGT